MIAATRRRIKQLAWKWVNSYGVTPQQVGLLLQLREGGGLSVHELAGRLHIDDPTCSRILARLTSRGLLVAEHCPGDRRRCRIQLTARGRRLTEQLAVIGDRLQEGFEKGLTAKDKRTLCDLLNRIARNIDALEALPVPQPSQARRAAR